MSSLLCTWPRVSDLSSFKKPAKRQSLGDRRLWLHRRNQVLNRDSKGAVLEGLEKNAQVWRIARLK